MGRAAGPHATRIFILRARPSVFVPEPHKVVFEWGRFNLQNPDASSRVRLGRVKDSWFEDNPFQRFELEGRSEGGKDRSSLQDN